jgi:hypothetical protein
VHDTKPFTGETKKPGLKYRVPNRIVVRDPSRLGSDYWLRCFECISFVRTHYSTLSFLKLISISRHVLEFRWYFSIFCFYTRKEIGIGTEEKYGLKRRQKTKRQKKKKMFGHGGVYKKPFQFFQGQSMRDVYVYIKILYKLGSCGVWDRT